MRTQDLGGLNGLSLDGTPMRRGSLWAFCKQKVFRSAAAWETCIYTRDEDTTHCWSILLPGLVPGIQYWHYYDFFGTLSVFLFCFVFWLQDLIKDLTKYLNFACCDFAYLFVLNICIQTTIYMQYFVQSYLSLSLYMCTCMYTSTHTYIPHILMDKDYDIANSLHPSTGSVSKFLSILVPLVHGFPCWHLWGG